jgi:hypothetical protein
MRDSAAIKRLSCAQLAAKQGMYVFCQTKQHYAAQAEYVRLAAQAWSPSDAMTQVQLKSSAHEKGSN